ncbi:MULTISPECIES: VIT1/CCC1 transporter family protein [Metallosphaera]|uniref:VIT1/CCC1 transporter family protein n=1 Tax=Metallosphaera TaxID=41980 RepID=UPI001EDED29E|nr:VIT1/CCC1 transporter family protein [Metallosphaera javensis (ex Hofmann et al. 2022)]
MEHKEIQHRTEEADVFRTKVFGVQDGLIGVGSIALGAAGFSHDSLLVLVTGLIATIAQAFSMGVGEFISTRVRMQVFNNEIRKEDYEIQNFPEKEKGELISFYEEKGFSREEAEKIAEILMRNRNVVLNEMMIHELKIFPEEFEKPAKLGLIMALYLVIGGLIPLIPFGIDVIFRIGFDVAILSSVALILITLTIFGSASTRYTGLPKWRGAGEQVATGLLALVGSYLAGYALSFVFPIPPGLF